MKVLCINTKPLPGRLNCELDNLVEGKDYTVIKEVNVGRFIGYHLEEIPCRNPMGFDNARFVPLSDIDETELVKEREQVNA